MPENSDTRSTTAQSSPPAQPSASRVFMEDPSEYRPELKDMIIGKKQESFRGFTNVDNERYSTVSKTYFDMHTQQTVEFVQQKLKEWGKLNHFKMTIMDAVKKLDDLVDESDPDIALPNSIHAFQTAERIREAHPDKEWFHLVGLIHDLGKVIALYGEPQWATVGDTFPVGCRYSEKCVFHEFFEGNPDNTHPVYSTLYGMYQPNCGLEKVNMSFGHDEYMYHVLVGNGTSLPQEGLYMIRYHSFYPWHTGNDYNYLCNDKDREMLQWIREFNKFDLYSKADDIPNVDEITPYYQSLIDKYIPGLLSW